MSSRTLQRLISAAFTASALAIAAAPASANSVDVSYKPPIIGIEMLYQGMGYFGSQGEFVDLAGGHITSASVVVDFTMLDGVDPSTFHMNMSVPVSDSKSDFFEVVFSDLTEVSPDHYSYSLTTDAFNGEVYSGRFGVVTYGLDSDENWINLPAIVNSDTGFYFTVDTPAAAVPEPSSALLLLGGLVFLRPLKRALADRKAQPTAQLA